MALHKLGFGFGQHIETLRPAIVFVIVLLLCIGAGLAQSDKHKVRLSLEVRDAELFTSYFGASTLPTKADIPAKTCGAIINEADLIVKADELKALVKDQLHVASLNLRSCATSPELARLERDLAVGLYGEVVSEQERRERAARLAAR